MIRFLVVQHTHAEFLGTFEHAFEARGIGFAYLRPFLGDALPPTPGAHDALWLLGGPWSPADREACPWLDDELRLIAAFRRARRPVIGLGMGALLVAAACAGAVHAGDRADRSGWQVAAACAGGATDPVVAAIDRQHVLVLHAGAVDPPAGVPPLATAQDGGWLVLRPDPTTYALLFRPEVKPGMIEDMVMEEDRSCPENVGEVLEEARSRWPSTQVLSARVVAALVTALDLMTERRKPPVIPIRALGPGA